MTGLRVALMVLAVINAIFAVFTAAVGLFADGGDIWSRLVLSALHPLAALAFIVLVILPSPRRTLVVGIAAILTANILADATLATAIGAGAIKGDWALPLIFSFGPAIALIYAIHHLRTQQSPQENVTES